MRLVLGISANEKPEARIFQFEDGKFTRSYAPHRIAIQNPRDAANDWERITFPEKIVNGLIRQVENDGFKIRAESHGIQVDAIGISMPGNIDRHNHVVNNIARIHYAPHRDRFGAYKDSLAKTNIKEVCDLALPLIMQNDVTCMARAESYLRFQDVFGSFVYIYIDTGVNIGVLIDGEPLPSAMHPELGHFRARLRGKPPGWTLKGADNFCGFAHEGCFESILAKSALMQRFDLERMLLNDGDFKKEREFIARCIAQLCEIAVLTFAPEKIVIGGYINDEVLHAVRSIFKKDLKGYPLYPQRQKVDFIERSPNPPDGIAALGAALLAVHKL